MDTKSLCKTTMRDSLSRSKRCAILLSGLVLMLGVACEEADDTDAIEQQLAEDQITQGYHSCGHCDWNNDCSNDDDTVRKFKRVVMMAKHSKKVATAQRNDSVTQQRFHWFRHRGRSQRWTLKELDSGLYEISNRRRGKCLGTVDPIPETPVTMQECDRSDGQLWDLQESDDGYLEIINFDSDMCLTVEGGSMDSGAALVQYSCDGDEAQQWKLFGFRLSSL
jgi:hypothetical protein